MIDNYVTGASGFIGGHLQKRLGVGTFYLNHRFITKFQFEPCRRFFFLSAYGNMAHHDKPRAMLRANVSDLAHVLNAIDDNALESFLYVSSSSVNLPVQSPYSRTKRAGEEMVQAMPIPGCIVRPFSITGRGEQSEHLIPKLIHSCMTGAQMDFMPVATHDFIDVEDVVDGLLLLADQRATGIFELGTGTAYTNTEVLSLVEKACGKRANINRVESLRAYDSPDWVCRDFKAREAGWSPKKSLEQSIAEMVEAYMYERA